MYPKNSKSTPGSMKFKLKILMPIAAIFLLSINCAFKEGMPVEIHTTTNPTGCEVYVDGRLHFDTTNCVIYDTISGSTIDLKILKDTFLSWDTTLDVFDTLTEEPIEIFEINKTFTGNLALTAMAVDSTTGDTININADIILDGEATGLVTPDTLENLIVGSHGVILTHENYAAFATVVNVCNDSIIEIVEMLGNEFGHVAVNSEPEGAEIWGNGVNTSEITPAFITGVAPGEYTVELKKEGYLDWVDTVVVFKDQITTIYAELVPIPATGSIQVNSTPTGAAIWLDGDSTGYTTNHELDSVSVGSHTVMLVMPGYEDWVDTITVTEGETEYINAVLEKSEGSEIWKYATGGTVAASPAIGADGTIYVSSNDGYLYAINPDGSEKWSRYIDVKTTATIGSDGTIYVGSNDSSLYAFNQDGFQKWYYKTSGIVRYSPAIGSNDTIYVGSDDGYLYAVSSEGDSLWSFPVNGSHGGSPAIGPDGTIYVGSRNGYLHAIKPDGNSLWNRQIGNVAEIIRSPALDEDGTIYAGSDEGEFFAVNSNGTLKWSYSTGEFLRSPAIGADGTIYVGCGNGSLYAFNTWGTLMWDHPIGEAIRSSPAVGSDGAIFVGADDGYLYAINAFGFLKWYFETEDRIISSPSIASDGTIYFGSNDGYLYAITSSSNGLADSPWPKYHHDNKNTGRYRGP